MLFDPSDLTQPAPVEPAPERAGFLTAPAVEERVEDRGVVADAGPWLLIDPEEIGGSDGDGDGGIFIEPFQL